MNIFPIIPNIQFGQKWSEDWSFVKVKKSGSGRRKTLCNRSYPDWKISVKFVGLDDYDIEQIAGFIGQQKGPFEEFLWLDPVYYLQERVRIGTGTGSLTQFQLLRNFDNRFVIPVTDVLPNSLKVFADATKMTVSANTNGLLTLSAAPASGAVVTASFQHYWRVAFDDSEYSWQDMFFNLYNYNQINLVTTWGD